MNLQVQLPPLGLCKTGLVNKVMEQEVEEGNDIVKLG